MGYPTPEAAALEQIPERYARVLGASVSPNGEYAMVLLGTNEPPRLYPYQVLCEREPDGWLESTSGNGSGWSSTSGRDDPEQFGVTTDWGQAPPDARAAVVSFRGADHEAPVARGYYLFVAWGVPVANSSEAPVLRRFI
jgi:hypothetical protein